MTNPQFRIADLLKWTAYIAIICGMYRTAHLFYGVAGLIMLTTFFAINGLSAIGGPHH